MTHSARSSRPPVQPAPPVGRPVLGCVAVAIAALVAATALPQQGSALLATRNVAVMCALGSGTGGATSGLHLPQPLQLSCPPAPLV